MSFKIIAGVCHLSLLSSSWGKPGGWRQSETFLKSVLFDAHAGDDDVDYDNYDGVDDVDVVIPTFWFFIRCDSIS